MRTTIALSAQIRDRLNELKRTWGTTSLDEVVARLLEGPAKNARTLFEEREPEIRKVLRKYGVKKLTAFGSRARGEGRPDSDLDLAGVMPTKADYYDVVHLQDELAAAFGVPVDFVALGEATRPRLRNEIQLGVKLVG